MGEEIVSQVEMTRASFAQRSSSALDRAQGFYLAVLRAVILVMATLLLGYAAWLAASSIYKISRSPDSVVEATAAVSPDELTNAELPVQTSDPAAKGKLSVNPAYQRFYSNFANRYFALYQSKFEPFRQAEDKQLSRSEFDGAFLNTSARLDAVSKGELSFEEDREDLNKLFAVMAQAAELPATVERLRRYKTARKVPVTKKVEKTRTEFVSGWDSSSEACSNWYETPYGCPVQRAVEVPYMETVTTNEFPAGTQSHTQIFKAFQDRYFSLLQERRETNARNAERERQSIINGIASGHLSLLTALQILGGFLVLMFFFLLIAIERHQRRTATILPLGAPDSED